MVLLAPVLTEITSGNTSVQALRDPRVVIFLLLAYGFPLIVIRELSVRWRLSAAGIVFLGLAYGFLNEGLLAQTLIRAEHVPIDRFDRYIFFAGFNLSWICLIVPWHALLAVLFPITLVHGWFPSCAKAPWLKGGTFRTLSAVLIAAVTLLAILRAPHPQMAICLAAMVVLTWLAYWAGRGKGSGTVPAAHRRSALLLGSTSYLLLFLGLIFLAALRVPAWLYFIAAGILLWLCWVLLRGVTAHMALGAYFIAALFNLTSGAKRHSVVAMLTGSLLAIAFAAAAAFWPRWGLGEASPASK